MGVNVDDIYRRTLKHFDRANQSLSQYRMAEMQHDSVISDVVPGFKADMLEFGSYDTDNFTVLFVDMRSSTTRALQEGPEKTFLTMHTYFPALLEVIKYYKGYVIDIMGDGLMVLFGGKKSKEEHNISRVDAIQNAGLCGRDMLIVRDKVINRIIDEKELGGKISIGIGVAHDKVIVTKIGINEVNDVKAFGDCINTASKYAQSVCNKVKVSQKVKNDWPVGENGKIKFESFGDGFLLESKS